MTTQNFQLASLLIGQWLSSPRLMGVVTDALQPILDGADTSTADIERMLDIDEAEGVWLDYIGVRLGIRRPATTDPAQDERFGFDDAGQPFDQALFRGFAENDAVYPLPDVVWRRFVKARVGDGHWVMGHSRHSARRCCWLTLTLWQLTTGI